MVRELRPASARRQPVRYQAGTSGDGDLDDSPSRPNYAVDLEPFSPELARTTAFPQFPLNDPHRHPNEAVAQLNLTARHLVNPPAPPPAAKAFSYAEIKQTSINDDSTSNSGGGSNKRKYRRATATAAAAGDGRHRRRSSTANKKNGGKGGKGGVNQRKSAAGDDDAEEDYFAATANGGGRADANSVVVDEEEEEEESDHEAAAAAAGFENSAIGKDVYIVGGRVPTKRQQEAFIAEFIDQANAQLREQFGLFLQSAIGGGVNNNHNNNNKKKQGAELGNDAGQKKRKHVNGGEKAGKNVANAIDVDAMDIDKDGHVNGVDGYHEHHNGTRQKMNQVRRNKIDAQDATFAAVQHRRAATVKLPPRAAPASNENADMQEVGGMVWDEGMNWDDEEEDDDDDGGKDEIGDEENQQTAAGREKRKRLYNKEILWDQIANNVKLAIVKEICDVTSSYTKTVRCLDLSIEQEAAVVTLYATECKKREQYDALFEQFMKGLGEQMWAGYSPEEQDLIRNIDTTPLPRSFDGLDDDDSDAEPVAPVVTEFPKLIMDHITAKDVKRGQMFLRQLNLDSIAEKLPQWIGASNPNTRFELDMTPDADEDDAHHYLFGEERNSKASDITPLVTFRKRVLESTLPLVPGWEVLVMVDPPRGTVNPRQLAVDPSINPDGSHLYGSEDIWTVIDRDNHELSAAQINRLINEAAGPKDWMTPEQRLAELNIEMEDAAKQIANAEATGQANDPIVVHADGELVDVDIPPFDEQLANQIEASFGPLTPSPSPSEEDQANNAEESNTAGDMLDVFHEVRDWERKLAAQEQAPGTNSIIGIDSVDDIDDLDFEFDSSDCGEEAIPRTDQLALMAQAASQAATYRNSKGEYVRPGEIGLDF